MANPFDKKVSCIIYRPPDQVGSNPKIKDLNFKMGKHQKVVKPTPISHKTKATSLKSG